MAYYKTVPIYGDPAKALEIVRNHFIYNGFELTELTATSFKATRPRRVSRVQHNPLAMLGSVSVELTGSSLTITAETSKQMLIIGIVLLALGLAFGLLLLLATQTGQHTLPKDFPYPLLFAPLIIGFVMIVVFAQIGNLANKSLDILLANAAMVAELR